MELDIIQDGVIFIYTYQDLTEIGNNEKERQAFILNAINAHKSSDTYKVAKDAEAYYRQENPTIMRYMKMVYNMQGKAVPDVYAANNKIPSNLYFYCVIAIFDTYHRIKAKTPYVVYYDIFIKPENDGINKFIAVWKDDETKILTFLKNENQEH